MSGDVILAWVLGCLVAGAWYMSPNRRSFGRWADLGLFLAGSFALGLAAFVAIVAVSS